MNIKDQIKQYIIQNIYQRPPACHKIAKELHLSSATVFRYIKILEGEGVFKINQKPYSIEVYK